MPPSKRQAIDQPDAEAVNAIIDKYRHSREEEGNLIAEQLESFFELMRGLGTPVTFSAASLATLDELFPSLAEQIEQEAKSTDEEGDDLMLLIQMAGFYLGAFAIEMAGGEWDHDPDLGSRVLGLGGKRMVFDPFDPFITKLQNKEASILQSFEKATGQLEASLDERAN